MDTTYVVNVFMDGDEICHNMYKPQVQFLPDYQSAFQN